MKENERKQEKMTRLSPEDELKAIGSRLSGIMERLKGRGDSVFFALTAVMDADGNSYAAICSDADNDEYWVELASTFAALIAKSDTHIRSKLIATFTTALSGGLADDPQARAFIADNIASGARHISGTRLKGRPLS